ncbi:MAG: ParA family protein [Prevotella sp.]|nr:ParA family protein [Prevotella sp.]
MNKAFVIAVIAFKGGTGKTTTSTSLAAAMAKRGEKVVLLDTDPQGNATRASGFPNERSFSRTLTDAIIKEQNPPVYVSPSGYHIVPASIGLVEAEIVLDNADNRYERIKRIIDYLSSKYKYVIIDCTPAILSAMNRCIVHASDFVIIPMEAESLALEGLHNIIQYIKSGDYARILGILFTRYKNRILYDNITKRVRLEYPGLVFSSVIRDCIKIPEAQSRGNDIFYFAPQSNGAQDYGEFSIEVIERIKRYNNGQK